MTATPNLETARFIEWLAGCSVQGARIGVAKATAIAFQTMRGGCILCHGPATVLGCFIPNAAPDSERQRLVLYALCAAHSAEVRDGTTDVDIIERALRPAGAA